MNFLQLGLTVITLGSILGVVVMALNLQYGHGGMVNLGLVAYFAAGAYTYAIVTQPPPSGVDQYLVGLAWPPWAGFLIAGIAAFLFALVTGPPSLRLRGEYLAITTFAFAEVLRSLIINERRIGNGTLGLAGIERPYQDLITFTEYDSVFAVVAALFAIVTFVILHRLVASPYGRLMEAIRDDDVAVVTSGKSVRRVRLSIFLLSALFIGWAGAFYVTYTTFATPSLFTASFTFSIFVALVFGGAGSFWRAMGGILVIILFEELVRSISFSTLRAAQIATGLQVSAFGLLLILFLRWQPFIRWNPLKRLHKPRYHRLKRAHE
jgi:branched-chain amino acid transport system permease protein